MSEESKALNEFARHKMYVKILQDIKFDITVCKLENWDYKQYLYQLRDLIDSIINTDLITAEMCLQNDRT